MKLSWKDKRLGVRGWEGRVMFLKTIQIGIKMTCRSDLTPVKGGRKQDGEKRAAQINVCLTKIWPI